ncbi:MAG: DUF3656 domain-containing protein, partial [Bacteroidaceae bacterium]|nr:DUF3656 domain-containing protein [Bacteroidaceae bacterium]
ARTPQENNIRIQLSKMGNTRFEVRSVEVRTEGERFIPSSLLSDMRRRVTERLESLRMESYKRPAVGVAATPAPAYPLKELTYSGNVMNDEACTFYRDHGVRRIDYAFERTAPDRAVIMTCRHCIRYAIGLCPKHHDSEMKVREPLYLRMQDDRCFRLRFDCLNCVMEVVSK